MYLLYLDESGNENDPGNRYFVLAGLALFERQIHYLNERIERVQEEHFPNRPPIPFHASAIRAGRGFWRGVSEEKRQEILDDVITAITATDDQRGLRLYAAAIEKDSKLYGERAVEVATEQVCKRFDTFLTRRFREHDDPQRGLLIFSEGRFDARAKPWVREFRRRGTRWGSINNLADIPYFAPMQESRLLRPPTSSHTPPGSCTRGATTRWYDGSWSTSTSTRGSFMAWSMLVQVAGSSATADPARLGEDPDTSVPGFPKRSSWSPRRLSMNDRHLFEQRGR